mgnify:CR=1 FL=1
MFYIFLVFLSLIFLIILHELSHFIAAKKSGLQVEEFGIGYPPRLFARKFGGTVYSLNLIPLGAFVKLPGEIGEGGFSSLPLFKRMIIVLAGVISFWIIAWVIFSFVFLMGIPASISDEEFSREAKVMIVDVAKNSPAQMANLKVGDVILKVKTKEGEFIISKVKDFQDAIQKFKGEKVILSIERNKNVFDAEIVPRIQTPPNEGPVGVYIVRTEVKKYSFLQAIFEGLKTTGNWTLEVIKGYIFVIKNITKGASSQVELMGPVGIVNILYQTSQIGLNYFLNLLAIISIHLAIFNLLPIPALDGGKFLFLVIEGIRKKPINPVIEYKITALSFLILIILAILVTFKDVMKIFE